MIGDFIFFEWASFYGGTIGNFLSSWEQAGFFSYVLPFLLIFAVIFGVLNQIQLFKDNRAINAIIALSVGLLALQFEFVPRFFSEIFPRLGVGLAIILVMLILAGIFVDPKHKGIMMGFFAASIVIIIIVLITTAGEMGWSSAYWWYDNWPTIVGIIAFIVIIAIIANSGKPPKPDKDYVPFWIKSNRE